MVVVVVVALAVVVVLPGFAFNWSRGFVGGTGHWLRRGGSK